MRGPATTSVSDLEIAPGDCRVPSDSILEPGRSWAEARELQSLYYQRRCHTGLAGATPAERSRVPARAISNLESHTWRHHCNGSFQTPSAAWIGIRHRQGWNQREWTAKSICPPIWKPESGAPESFSATGLRVCVDSRRLRESLVITAIWPGPSVSLPWMLDSSNARVAGESHLF